MSINSAAVANRVQRGVVALVASVALAVLIVRHSAARKEEQRRAN
jgi:hypothetical protein